MMPTTTDEKIRDLKSAFDIGRYSVTKTVTDNNRPIYYSLQSSTAILGVFCNACNAECSFCYSWPHENIAYWTIGKKQILCPRCAKDTDYKDSIYRKVFDKNDIPLGRSSVMFKDSPRIARAFSSDHQNKQTHRYRFCTEEDEQKEFQMDSPPTVLCNCPECNPVKL